MAKRELTKELLGDTLKKLSAGKQLDKISISEIVEAAGLNRQTFYYHFQDKQELICWMFDTAVAELTDAKEDGTLLDDVVDYLYRERAFYSAALTSEAQNNLREHIFQVYRKSYTEEIRQAAGEGAIDPAVMDQLSRFFSNGLTGSLVQWAQGGMKYENVRFIEEYPPFTKELLLFAVDKYAKRPCF